jgi:hypothetical protein
MLLGSLREVGAGEQVAALLARDPAAQVDLRDASGVARLLRSLRKLKANEQAVALAERLPAVGLFDVFNMNDDHRERYRFGREPDGSAAEPWSWDDLQ